MSEQSKYYNELPPDVQEVVLRDLQDINVDHEWWDGIYEDFSTICELLGVELDSREPQFSGFWSQGDGASFTGSYSYRKGSLAAIRAHAPQDEELHTIARELQQLQRPHFYSLEGTITRSRDLYVHEMTMQFNLDDGWSICPNLPASLAAFSALEDAIQDQLRSLAQWLYSSLEREYEYLTSEDAIVETITTNEYTFNAEGELV